MVDGAGVIRDFAVNSEELSRDLAGGEWFGRPWLETVTEDSRPKVEALIRDAAARAAPRWRHINQVAALGGASVPILFSAVRLGKADRAVAFGRDLRAVSALQQRLMEAQRSVERDYARLRQAETRYRLLFQMSPEPVLVLDAATAEGGGGEPRRRPALRQGGAARHRPALRRGLRRREPGGRAEPALRRARRRPGRRRARAARDRRPARGRRVRLPVPAGRRRFRARPAVAGRWRRTQPDPIALPKTKSKLLKLVEGVPDGFVVTGQDGRILSANAAFLEMAQIAVEEQAVGEPLDRWFGASPASRWRC